MANNIVIAGKHQGCKIEPSVQGQYAVLTVIGSNRKIYLNQLNVADVSEINRESANSLSKALVGAMLFGTGGAVLGAKGKSEIILEITWESGGQSLIQVDSNIHKKIIIGMYEEITETKQQEIEKSDDSTKSISTGLSIFIFVALYIYFTFIGS